MKKFDKANLAVIRLDVASALETVAKKHGITIDLGKCSYSEVNAKFELSTVIASPETLINGVNMNTAEARDYEHILKWGSEQTKSLPPLGTVFKSNMLKHKIVGWAKRRPKRPVMTETPDGRKWIFPVEQVILCSK
jgi:hypothetical protein